MEEDETPSDLKRDGRMPVGNIYIDRWRPGETIERGCYLYYKGETLGDYCARNGEPLPMRRIPEEVYDCILDQRFGDLKDYFDEVPELGAMMMA